MATSARASRGGTAPVATSRTAVGAASSAISDNRLYSLPLLAILFPVAVSLRYGKSFFAEAPLAEALATAERRAGEVLDQEESAPRLWAEADREETAPERRFRALWKSPTHRERGRRHGARETL